ncbi:MAG TPA: GDP-mannose 4,6-dehydratase [Sedimentisphaerales bacterium]|nr:GDP-mannose 4,6-dehydratase [Sedimentisphaerales bacterium]
MRSLITGGAGFIGSHLAEALLNRGQEVVVLDNLSTGRLENIAGFQGKSGFEFFEADVRDVSVLEGLVEKCDFVYHLAAAVGVQLIADRPVHTIKTNIEGTEVALELCNKYKRKIIIASSSEVYGKSDKIPFCEEDDLVLGNTSLSRWSYACSKAIDEFLGLAYYQQFGLEVIIGRFFNMIGPRQTGQYGMVVPRFVQAALKNEPVSIYGSGRQSRCFCYVGDLVKALIALMECKEAAGEVYNIGSDEEITIEGLADKIIEMTNSKSKKVFIGYEKAYGRVIEDMMRRKPSVNKLKKMVSWQREKNLEQTLEIIIDSFKK